MFDMHEVWDYLLSQIKNTTLSAYLVRKTSLRDMVYYGFCDSLVIILEAVDEESSQKVSKIIYDIEDELEESASFSIIITIY
jgi:hypothetical protein